MICSGEMYFYYYAFLFCCVYNVHPLYIYIHICVCVCDSVCCILIQNYVCIAAMFGQGL